MTRRRRAGLPAYLAGSVATGISGWQFLGEPVHTDGLLAGVSFCSLLALVLPAAGACLPKVPMLLIPADTRKNYRKRWPREDQKSAYIPKWLQRMVHAADRHRCCYCGQDFDLAVDHIFPWSLGGLTVFWNLATLCRYCNTVKSNYWMFRSGHSVYVPYTRAGLRNVANRELAAEILAFELHHRWRPDRWIRASFALVA